MFKVNNENTRTTSGVFIVNYLIPFSSVFIVDFEQVNISWVVVNLNCTLIRWCVFFLRGQLIYMSCFARFWYHLYNLKS